MRHPSFTVREQTGYSLGGCGTDCSTGRFGAIATGPPVAGGPEAGALPGVGGAALPGIDPPEPGIVVVGGVAGPTSGPTGIGPCGIPGGTVVDGGGLPGIGPAAGGGVVVSPAGGLGVISCACAENARSDAPANAKNRELRMKASSLIRAVLGNKFRATTPVPPLAALGWRAEELSRRSGRDSGQGPCSYSICSLAVRL